jgi:hypothetical protein
MHFCFGFSSIHRRVRNGLLPAEVVIEVAAQRRRCLVRSFAGEGR